MSQAVHLLSQVEGVGHIKFLEGDVVRHDLVRRIVDAYSKSEREQAASAAERK